MIKRIDKILLLYILTGIILCGFVTFPFFNMGFFPTHDGEWAVVRASEMFREIRDFQFPPRYSGALNFGYGYPLFNFAYPFPYYLTTAFHALSFSFIESVKAVFVVSTFVSFFSMLALSLYFWRSKLAGFVSAVLYLFLPYRMVDLYVRGSIGETVAFALYPLILLCMFFILDQKKRNFGIFGVSLGIGILALTHNISAVYFGLIILAFILSLLWIKKYKETLYVVISVAWGGLLSSFFIIPALYERQYIKLSKIPIADRDLYFVTVAKLFVPSWGYGTPTDSNPFSYSFGIPQVIGYVLSFFAIFKTKNSNKAITVSLTILVFVMILMMFPAFKTLWELPLLSEINYPWTLLLPMGFLISFLSGSLATVKKLGIYVSAVLLLTSVLLTYSYAKPESYINRGDEYYITNEATTTSSNELMPLWVNKMPNIRFEEKIETEGKVDSLVYKSNKIDFFLDLQNDNKVQINQIYYPGWKAFVNGASTPIEYNNSEGLMEINVPKGKSNITLVFSDTYIRMFFNFISIVSFLALCIYAFRFILTRKHKKV